MTNIKKKIHFGYLALLIFCALSLLITFLVGNDKLFLFINKTLANPVLDFIVLYIFVPLFFLLVAIPFLMFFSKKYRFLGLSSLTLGFLSYFLGELIKPLFAIPRPYEFLPARILGPWHPGIFSFPSTTTILAFGLTLPILRKQPKLGSFLLFLAFLVGFSVIYTGFHTPYDVLAGILFFLFLYFLLSLFNKTYLKNIFFR